MPIKMMFGMETVPDCVLSIRYSRLKDRIIHIAYDPSYGFKVYVEDMNNGDIKASNTGKSAEDFVRGNFGAHGMNLLKIHSKGEFTDKEAEVVEKVFKAFSYTIKRRQEGREAPDQYLGTPPAKVRNTFIDSEGEEENITIDENTFTVH